jgi:chromosome segregation protein
VGTSRSALAELLVAREGEAAALAAELGALRSDNTELIARLRHAEAGAAARPPSPAASERQAWQLQAALDEAHARLEGALSDKASLAGRVRELQQRLAAAAALSKVDGGDGEDDQAAGRKSGSEGDDGGAGDGSPQRRLRLRVRHLAAQLAETEAAAEREASALRAQASALQGHLEDARAAAADADLRRAAAGNALALAQHDLEQERGRAAQLEGRMGAAQREAARQQEAAMADARAVAEGVSGELRRELGFLQRQFEEVVEEATQREGELEAARAEAAAGKAELAEVSAALRRSEEGARDAAVILQSRLDETTAREADARWEMRALCLGASGCAVGRARHVCLFKAIISSTGCGLPAQRIACCQHGLK